MIRQVALGLNYFFRGRITLKLSIFVINDNKTTTNEAAY